MSMDLELSAPVYTIAKKDDGYRMVVDWILTETLGR